MQFLVKLTVSLIATVIALIPVWIYLLAKWVFAPEGFWQNFFLSGVGVWLLGSVQVILLVILLIVFFAIWSK